MEKIGNDFEDRADGIAKDETEIVEEARDEAVNCTDEIRKDERDAVKENTAED